MRLIDFKGKELWRGTTFRFLHYGLEQPKRRGEITGLMLVENLDTRSLGFMYITGYNAGFLLVAPPRKAFTKRSSFCMSTDWVKQNWNEWIIPDCPIEEVYIREHSPIPKNKKLD